MSEPIVTESSAIDGIVLKEEDENSTDGTYGKETRVQPSDEVETAGIFDSNGSAAEEPENATVDASEQVTLLMVGDILLHVPVEKSAKREDGSYSYDAIFAETKELIQAADLALVNQEVILGGTELGISGYPAFNAPYEVGDDLVEAGFDVICHATNHALDKGKKGVTNCLNFWKTNYPEITILGLHENPEDPLYIFEKDGIKVAFLNYTYGTNGISLPEDMPYAVDLLSNKSKVIADIQYAESVADFTVVCPHWGTEYRLTADASQEKWTKIFLENGVDLVLGTHPHVIEPVEQITDEETGHSMLVYYSLGNYVNWTSSSGDGIANRMVGGMAQITLERGEDGEVAISDYGVTALVCHLTGGQDGVTVWPLSSYSEELAADNEIRKQDPSFSYSYCTDLCDRVWGDLWN
ncbi:MAG: CapA family protein [Lachnospiraceae bacterium]|nr:CapA family protein [Lachnospiraceae bacterium]